MIDPECAHCAAKTEDSIRKLDGMTTKMPGTQLVYVGDGINDARCWPCPPQAGPACGWPYSPMWVCPSPPY